ncbi:MAG TPA: hypothetical protein QGG18_11095 [Rhodospirillales bacterium]|nr:hypothetical protein [Rhodospirillales bacterium]
MRQNSRNGWSQTTAGITGQAENVIHVVAFAPMNHVLSDKTTITAMGLEIARGKAKTPGALGAILKKNIKNPGAPGRDDIFGWGFARRKSAC